MKTRQTHKKKRNRHTKRKKTDGQKEKKDSQQKEKEDRQKVKSDFSVSLCPFLNFSTHRHKTQNGHLFDTQTHGHKMDTELDNK